MNSRKKYRSELVNYLINSKSFKITIALLLFFSFYELIYANTNYGYIDAIIEILSISNFVFFLSLLICVSTIFIYSRYSSNTFYIMRLKTKKEYIKDLLCNVVMINTFIFGGAIIFISVFVIIKSLFFAGVGASVYSYIPNWIYLVFLILKIYLMTMSFAILFTMIMICINRKLGSILFYLYVLKFYFFSYSGEKITSIFEMKWLPVNYILPLNYATFSLEVICACMYIFLITSSIYFVYYCLDFFGKKKDMEV